MSISRLCLMRGVTMFNAVEVKGQTRITNQNKKYKIFFANPIFSQSSRLNHAFLMMVVMYVLEMQAIRKRPYGLPPS